jgi:N-acetylglucosaminyl-diphospho-decaprenol L-rhamnosyltransferase
MGEVASGSGTSASAPVGVVTVSFGSDDVLPAMLHSIPSAAGAPVEVVVVDNRPGGGAVRALAEKAGARYLARPDNPGYGGAMNAGAALLSSSVEWVLIANPDLVLTPGSIARLRERGESDPAIAAVGPLVRESDGAIYPSARAVPSIRTGIGHALFVNLWPNNPWTRSYLDDSPIEPVRKDAGWLSGSCVLVRRSAFDAMGGFDEGYFMYFEDVDLGFRFGKAGLRNVYEPAAEVTHSGAHATGRDGAAMIQAHHISARRFLERKYPGVWLWPVRVVLAVGLRIRSDLITRRLRRMDQPAPN